MKELKFYLLGELGEITSSKRIFQSEYVDDGIPFYRTKEIKELANKEPISNELFISRERYEEIKVKFGVPEVGDILITAIGTVGEIYIVENEKEFYFKDGNILWLKGFKDVDPFFLRYLLSSLINELQNLSSGSAYKALPITKLKEYKIPLPPIEEQRRIAAILDKADGVRRKHKEAIRLTEELLKSTFLEMFGDPVTNPKGWEIAKLGDFGKILTGNTPPRSVSENYGDEIEWIKSDNITTPEHFLTEAEEKLSAKGKKIARTVPNGSVLVTCIAGSRSSIGRAALTDREVAFNQQINAVVPNSDVDPYFLYGQLFVAQHLVQAQSTDSMKGMVNKSKFSSIEFIKPPSQKQQKFGKWFLGFHRYYMNLISGEEQSENLFNSLLQRAFRGEL
jgi:type I restriction enzyme S subunit